MLQREYSAIFSTFIKLPVFIKTFVLSILSGRYTHVLLYYPTSYSFAIPGILYITDVTWLTKNSRLIFEQSEVETGLYLAVIAKVRNFPNLG